MWDCVLTPVSGYFTPNNNSETHTAHGKADYTIVSTIFHYVYYLLNTSILFHITRVPGFDFQWKLGIFLFTTATRMALGPTQLAIQWVPEAFSLGLKRPGREADHSPPSSAEVK
jgi:hypothetical protein